MLLDNIGLAWDGVGSCWRVFICFVDEIKRRNCSGKDWQVYIWTLDSQRSRNNSRFDLLIVCMLAYRPSLPVDLSAGEHVSLGKCHVLLLRAICQSAHFEKCVTQSRNRICAVCIFRPANFWPWPYHQTLAKSRSAFCKLCRLTVRATYCLMFNKVPSFG